MSACLDQRLLGEILSPDRDLRRLDLGRPIIATTGVILSAVYALTLYRKVVFGGSQPRLAAIGGPGLP